MKLRNSALLLSLHPLKLNSPNMVKHAGRAQLHLQLTRALCSPSPNYVFITAGERRTHTFKGTFLQLIPCKSKLKHLPPLSSCVLCFSFIFLCDFLALQPFFKRLHLYLVTTRVNSSLNKSVLYESMNHSSFNFTCIKHHTGMFWDSSFTDSLRTLFMTPDTPDTPAQSSASRGNNSLSTWCINRTLDLNILCIFANKCTLRLIIGIIASSSCFPEQTN